MKAVQPPIALLHLRFRDSPQAVIAFTAPDCIGPQIPIVERIAGSLRHETKPLLIGSKHSFSLLVRSDLFFPNNDNAHQRHDEPNPYEINTLPTRIDGA